MVVAHALRSAARTATTALPRNGGMARSMRQWNGLQQQLAAYHATASRQELTKFLMPAMSPTMTEGGIATWKKKPGEAFSAGDVLLEIETDKATMDVEAQDDGVMAKIIVEDGSKNVPVNSVIAITGEEGDDLSGADALAKEAESEGPPKTAESEAPKEESESPKQEEKKAEKPAESKDETPKSSPQEQQSTSSQASPAGRVFASPLARRLAQEKGIPLAQIKGTGPNGRIVKADIDSYKPAAQSDIGAAATQAASATGKGAAAAPAPAAAQGTYTDTPVSSMRKIIASRLTESSQERPHYFVSIDVEMDKVLRLRKLFNDAAAEQSGGDAAKVKAAKLSVGDFITKAASIALRQVPEVNASWMGDTVRQYHTEDISIAVSTPNGLITPIVKNVGSNGLATISSTTKELAARARQGKLQQHEYQGGSFTISNMGMYGITNFTAIINPPQSAILAIGGTEPRMVVDESEEQGWRKAMVMQATISADHRIIDGATAARWMKAFKDTLENPLSFML